MLHAGTEKTVHCDHIGACTRKRSESIRGKAVAVSVRTRLVRNAREKRKKETDVEGPRSMRIFGTIRRGSLSQPLSCSCQP